MLAVVSGILSPPFDLVVGIHAGVPLKLADEELGVTSGVSDCITCCPSLTFPLVFFLTDYLQRR